MNLTGTIKKVQRDLVSRKWLITLEVNEELADELNGLALCKKLSIVIKRFRKKRSLNANGLFWECIKRISQELKADKWDIYLELLRKNGNFEYVCVKPRSVKHQKKLYRICEEISRININGKEAVQLLCYMGSSHFDTYEFSQLLDTTFYEMIEIGLQPPTADEKEGALEQWEKDCIQHSQKI